MKISVNRFALVYLFLLFKCHSIPVGNTSSGEQNIDNDDIIPHLDTLPSGLGHLWDRYDLLAKNDDLNPNESEDAVNKQISAIDMIYEQFNQIHQGQQQNGNPLIIADDDQEEPGNRKRKAKETSSENRRNKNAKPVEIKLHPLPQPSNPFPHAEHVDVHYLIKSYDVSESVLGTKPPRFAESKVFLEDEVKPVVGCLRNHYHGNIDRFLTRWQTIHPLAEFKHSKCCGFGFFCQPAPK